MWYPNLEDLLLTAAELLGAEPMAVYGATKISLAESALAAPRAGFGDYDLYPEPVTKGAILCSRIARNHALPDGNKRVAWTLMRLFFITNDIAWTRPDACEAITMVRRVAGEEPRLSEAEFVDWVTSYGRGAESD